MRNVVNQKGLRCTITLFSVFAILIMPGCAWIEEFDAQGRPQYVDIYHSAEPLRIAWINSYSENNVWSLSLQSGILETLGRAGYSKPVGTLEWQAFHLNAVGDESFALLRYRAEYMLEEILSYEPDLIIVSDDEAALSLAPIYPDKDVPIIYCGVTTDFQVTGLDQPNIIGTPEELYVEETLAIARSMIPVQGRILILAEDSLTGKASANSATAIIANDTEEYAPVIELVRDWESWMAAVQEHHTDVDMIFIVSQQPLFDADRNVQSSQEMVDWTKDNSEAPVFGFTRTAVANGAVAGLVTDAYDHGRSAAEIATYLANDGDITMVESELRLEQTNRLVLNLDSAQHWSLDIPVMLTLTADIHAYTHGDGGH